MIKTKILKVSLVVAIILCLCLAIWIFSPIKAESPSQTVITDQSVIIFDLAKANVTIDTNTYSGKGYRYNIAAGTWEYYEDLTGEHLNDNKYYVFQSNGENVAEITTDGSGVILPAYADIDDEIFKNKTDVVGVIKAWQTAAEAAGRASTPNYILISAGGKTCNLTIENIWSSHQKAQTMTGGGISISGATAANTEIYINLKGDNRIHSLRYHTNTTKTSKLVIDSAEQGTTKGSLVVIGQQGPYQNNGNYRYKNADGTYTSGKACYNHWDSVIGGTDNDNKTYGMYFNGGTIYAGATKWENCTAIGGGGNGDTTIFINGAHITAVASTTGAAIGGGIAHLAKGGPATISITKGTVYAYNFGQPFAETLSESGLNGLKSNTGEISAFVPGTAIGGGGSAYQDGSAGTVTISGNNTYVYAESYGGSGIGGGNTVGNPNVTSTTGIGGTANVTIEGGTVISVSKSYHLTTTNAKGNNIDEVIPAGTGIGGGTSVHQNGGIGTVTISGGRVTSNGIGGGGSTDKNGGDANVYVSGGTIVADNIGGGYSETNGYARGTVEIIGGSLNSELAIVPTNNNDVPVYLTTVGTADYNNYAISDEKLSRLDLKNATEYNLEDVYTDEKGIVYLWLPASEAVKSARVGETEVRPIDESDNEINAKNVGLLRVENGLKRYMVSIVESDRYELYMSEDKNVPYSGVMFYSANDKCTYYLKSMKNENGDYYTVVPYKAITDPNGNKIFLMDSNLDSVVGVDGYYTKTFTVDGNKSILFEVKSGEESIFVIDWYDGDINITSDPKGGVIIEQNGYVLSGYKGSLYVTTGGLPCSNRLNVDCDEKTLNIYFDNVNVSSSSSPVNVKSGTVDISFSEKDNLISSTSSEESAFSVDEDATLIINSEGGKSLKVDSEENVPAISGTGTIVLKDSNGHLKLNEANNLNNSTPEISIGTYQYKGTNPKYNAVLNNGEFSFKLIGYVDSSGTLFPNQMSGDNKLDFSARGIVKVYTKSVETVSEEVVNGNYVIKYDTTQPNYTLIPPTLELLDGTKLFNGTDYLYNEDTKTLTIYGTAFAKENIRIFAYTEGEISYISQSVEKTYTGEEFHIGIQLQESKFDIYYREGVAFSANPTEDDLEAEGVFKNQHITKTDVCNTNIYFYIKAKPEYDDENYQPVRGSEKLVITKGVNEFIGAQLACKDVVLNSSPNPVIKSKWGTPEYLYYSDPEGNNPVDVGVIGTVTDTYYVKAFVVETDNYDRIETDYLIRFEVFKTEVFTSTEKSFTPVSGTDTTLSMPANTAFSIYYDTTYNGEMKIEFSAPLSAGTKITLIDFSEEKAMYYVYFTKDTDVTDGKTQIPMDSFYLMGDESTKLNPSNGDRISYQFCVEANQTDFVYMEVKFGEMTTITIEPLAARNTQFSEELKSNTAIGTARIPISIDSSSAAFGGKKNVVTVRMPGFPDGAFIYLSTNDGNIINPSLSNGIFVFDLGDSDKTREEYDLVIENLDDSVYEIDLDVRICDERSMMYPLADKSSNNHYEITLQYSRSSNVYIVMSDRIIEKGTMKIMFTPVIRSDIEKDNIYGGIYKKALTGGYELYAEFTPNNIQLIQTEAGGYAIEVILVDTPLTEGTYKIKATVNGKECEYMFIVQ